MNNAVKKKNEGFLKLMSNMRRSQQIFSFYIVYR